MTYFAVVLTNMTRQQAKAISDKYDCATAIDGLGRFLLLCTVEDTVKKVEKEVELFNDGF